MLAIIVIYFTIICSAVIASDTHDARSLIPRSCNRQFSPCCHPPSYACGPKVCCPRKPPPPKCSGEVINGFCCPNGHVQNGSCTCGGNNQPPCDATCKSNHVGPNHLDCCMSGLGILDDSNTCKSCGALGHAGLRSCNGACNSGLKYSGGRCMQDDAVTSPSLIIMCRVQGFPTDGDTNKVQQLFTTQGGGTNNLFDYFTEMSYGRLDMSATQVMGWVDSGLAANNGRYAFTVACANAAVQANPGFPFENYEGIVSVLNSNLHIDGGNAGYNTNQLNLGGITHTYGLVNVDTFGEDTEFLAHEMGHSLGFYHSRDDRPDNCGGSPGEYCDRWDEMSAENNYFGQNTYGRQAGSFVAAYRIKESWLLPNEIIDAGTGYNSVVKISAINRPELSGPRVVRIQDHAGTVFTVELMTKTGWDSSIPRSAVLVHQLDSALVPTIVTSFGGDFGVVPVGNSPATLTGATYSVTVNSIDEGSGTAEVYVTVH